jgi:hypothetical protein
MADIDMTDAPASAAGPVARKKTAAGDSDSKGDGKKRFEVKKVSARSDESPKLNAI